MEQITKYMLYISMIGNSKNEYKFYCTNYNEKYNFTNCKNCAYIFTDKTNCEQLSKQYVTEKDKYEKLFSDWVNEPIKFNLVIIEEL